MKVADFTVDELQALIRKVVHEELQDIIADPDKGLELTGEIQARLQSSLGSSDRIPVRGSQKQAESRLTYRVQFTPQRLRTFPSLIPRLPDASPKKVQWFVSGKHRFYA